MTSDISGRSENITRLVNRLRDETQLNQESAADTVGIEPSRAAVLICLFEDERGDLRVILTRRSPTLSSHSGEVALPGGKRDEKDADDVETALREADEEIGLSPSMVEFVATLEPFHTRINMIVVPVVGVIWDKRAFTPIPNAAEVECVFYAPLEMFLKDENRRQMEKELHGYKFLLQFFDHQIGDETYVIWVLTAGVLIQAASVVYQKPPAFEERRAPYWSMSNR